MAGLRAFECQDRRFRKEGPNMRRRILVKGHEGVPVGGQVVSLCADS